jgi:CspA family cold shock protein
MPRPFVIARVQEWRDQEGWGVLDSEQIPDLIWAHFSSIEADGYRSLTAGEWVHVEVEGPLPFDQDGYRYRAIRVAI